MNKQTKKWSNNITDQII